MTGHDAPACPTLCWSETGSAVLIEHVGWPGELQSTSSQSKPSHWISALPACLPLDIGWWYNSLPSPPHSSQGCHTCPLSKFSTKMPIMCVSWHTSYVWLLAEHDFQVYQQAFQISIPFVLAPGFCCQGVDRHLWCLSWQDAQQFSTMTSNFKIPIFSNYFKLLARIDGPISESGSLLLHHHDGWGEKLFKFSNLSAVTWSKIHHRSITDDKNK